MSTNKFKLRKERKETIHKGKKPTGDSAGRKTNNKKKTEGKKLKLIKDQTRFGRGGRKRNKAFKK